MRGRQTLGRSPGKTGEFPLPKPLEGAWPCPHLDLGPVVSPVVRVPIPAAFRHPVSGKVSPKSEGNNTILKNQIHTVETVEMTEGPMLQAPGALPAATGTCGRMPPGHPQPAPRCPASPLSPPQPLSPPSQSGRPGHFPRTALCDSARGLGLLGKHGGCRSSSPHRVRPTGRGGGGGCWSTGGRRLGAGWVRPGASTAGPPQEAPRPPLPALAGDGRAVNRPAVLPAAGRGQEVSVINQGLPSYDRFIRQMNLRAQRASRLPACQERRAAPAPRAEAPSSPFGPFPELQTEGCTGQGPRSQVCDLSSGLSFPFRERPASFDFPLEFQMPGLNWCCQNQTGSPPPHSAA